MGFRNEKARRMSGNWERVLESIKRDKAKGQIIHFLESVGSQAMLNDFLESWGSDVSNYVSNCELVGLDYNDFNNLKHLKGE